MDDDDVKITFTTSNTEPPTDLQLARSALLIAATEFAICSLQQGVAMQRASEETASTQHASEEVVSSQISATSAIAAIERLLQTARDFIHVEHGGEFKGVEKPPQRTPLVSIPLEPEGSSPDPRQDG